jgi:hypothetical protein
METILGLFKRREDADGTLKALLKAGFSPDEISVLSHDELLGNLSVSEEQRNGLSELREIVSRSAGDILGALASLVIPVENARLYAEGVKHGGVLVIARTTNELAPAAEMIMLAARAEEVRSINLERMPADRRRRPGEREIDEREAPLLWGVLQEAF